MKSIKLIAILLFFTCLSNLSFARDLQIRPNNVIDTIVRIINQNPKTNYNLEFSDISTSYFNTLVFMYKFRIDEAKAPCADKKVFKIPLSSLKQHWEDGFSASSPEFLGLLFRNTVCNNESFGSLYQLKISSLDRSAANTYYINFTKDQQVNITPIGEQQINIKINCPPPKRKSKDILLAVDTITIAKDQNI